METTQTAKPNGSAIPPLAPSNTQPEAVKTLKTVTEFSKPSIEQKLVSTVDDSTTWIGDSINKITTSTGTLVSSAISSAKNIDPGLAGGILVATLSIGFVLYRLVG